MKKLLVIAIAGAAAQLVDGGIGMGFGALSTSMLIFLAGLGPAQASAVVHTAEVGTTLCSGISHWKFGNVDAKVLLKIGVPGAIGAFLGANVLTQLSTEAARPITQTILALIGVNLLWRFARGKARSVHRSYRGGVLGCLGLFGGFIDASGGGGWGPVTTSSLLSMGRQSPRKIVGTVSAAEFLVSLSATLGFAFGMREALLENIGAIIALLIGGAITSPIAAWLISRINPTALGGLVGTALMVINVPGLPLKLILLAVGLGVTLRSVIRSKQERPLRSRVVRATEPENIRQEDLIHQAR
ncbi:sulfite exporter TauE/SafE family protein [Corynebacterium pseudopelargi]|uniref:Probable membrane transporter protein n=1 Tax=Corynebacterium pseudopelargi TaxID=2080757 RepID=A0A3G6IWP1_9CORY|nr:sulfite exporter TauE/SafE family protein [Corynebacterium pseudopelargi]AZA08374.1 Sulfite exporter TauE/SafE [Corynebacterium pseudopelargi]